MVQIVDIDQDHIRFEFLRSWKSQYPIYKYQTGQQLQSFVELDFSHKNTRCLTNY